MKKIFTIIIFTLTSLSSYSMITDPDFRSATFETGWGEFSAVITTSSLPTALILDSGEELTSEELVLRAAEEAANEEIGINIEILAEELDMDVVDLLLELRAQAID